MGEVDDGVALRANRRIVRRDHDAHPVLAQRAERGGDVASRGLIKLREEGVSVVIATHDPSIRAQCDAIIDLANFQDEEEQR